MFDFSALVLKVGDIEKVLGYRFVEKKWLLLAFVHRSYFNENRDEVAEPNERLEFLGDSVLGLIVSDYLFKRFPEHPEGLLSQMRAQLVDSASCVRLVEKLQLDSFVLLGKGERLNAGRGRLTILADLFEAIIGAIYLDGGFEAANEVFFRHFMEELQQDLRSSVRNWKADLQDYAQKKYQVPPLYKVVREFGPDHSKSFEVAVFMNEVEMGRGMGNSKKIAEQSAAEEAWKKLSEGK